MTASFASITTGVIAAAGIVLSLTLGVVWLVLLLRTRAKLRAIEKSLPATQTGASRTSRKPLVTRRH